MALAVATGTVVQRFSQATTRKGAPVTLRRITKDASGLPNPPTLVNPVVNGATAASATTISIRADQAIGFLATGDVLTIGALSAIAVAAPVESNPIVASPTTPTVQGFTNISLASPLPSAVADGTPIVVTWVADTTVHARVVDFPINLKSDQIQTGDLSVLVPTFGISPAPTALDQVIVNGLPRSIVTVTPTYAGADIVAWRLQAR